LNGGDVPTVASLWAVYVEKHVERNVVAPKQFGKCWKNLEPHFGALKVSGVSQDIVDKYEGKRRCGAIGKPSVQATVRKELVLLRACFNWCANPKRKVLKPEEVPLFDLPPDSAPNDRWLREEELAKLKAVAAEGVGADDRMTRGERVLWIGLETAARSEAIRQLTWDRVDWETKTIDFNVPGRRRTKKRRAVVPISGALEPILRRMYQERIGHHVLDNDAEVGRLIDRVADRAGIADVSPHVLRHTAATHMARRGVPLFIIAKILGNSVALVERVYAKHQPEDLRRAINKISEVEL
jgi:integrase